MPITIPTNSAVPVGPPLRLRTISMHGTHQPDAEVDPHQVACPVNVAPALHVFERGD